MNRKYCWILCILLRGLVALTIVSGVSGCKQKPRKVEYPLSTVLRQSLDNYNITVDGNSFPASGRPIPGSSHRLSEWAWGRETQGEPVEEGTTFITYYPDLRVAPYGPFDAVRVTDPAYVDWQILKGTKARMFRIKTPLCEDSTSGFVLILKCPDKDPVLITKEVLWGISEMKGLQQIAIGGMYSGTQEDLTAGLQRIIDTHNPEGLGLGFISEDGTPPDICALKFGDALRFFNWIELASDYAPKYELTQSEAPTKIFSPYDIVMMHASRAEIATFQRDICGDK